MNYRIQEIKALFYRILLVFLFYTIFRFLFIYFNYDLLDLNSNMKIIDLALAGLRFDFSAIVYINSIFIFLSIIPLPYTTKRLYQKLLFVVYFVFNGIGMLMNFIDFGYYRFNLNRIMSNFFEVIKYETNKKTLFFHFFYTHFNLVLLYIILFFIWVYLYKKISIQPSKILKLKNYIFSSIIFFFSIILISIIGARGGDLKKSSRPITIIDAMNNVNNPVHADIILNSPFTVIRTINQDEFKLRKKFKDEEILKLLKPIKKYSKKSSSNPNVVLFILESMSREYWGSMNTDNNIDNYISYTPFLDSLAKHSLVFSNAFATSRKSIHAMPSIIAGVPSFEVAYTSSRYSKQKIESIVSVANKLNYDTSFFHGASNGSMGFLGFSNTLGYKNYYGRDEYNNDKEFDGYWGIWDEPFLQFMKSEIDKKQSPFLSTVFTISSHEPYVIPSKYDGKFKKGSIDMHQCVGYTDYALKRFFNESKNSDWFENTVFIFTADHGNQSYYPYYEKIINRFASPIMIYKPGSDLIGIEKTLASHMDIFPTIAQIMGYNESFRSWGRSLISENNEDPFVINYFGGGSYFMMDERFICIHNGEKAKGFYSLNDQNLENNLIENKNDLMKNLEKKGSVFLQDYFNRIINGEM